MDQTVSFLLTAIIFVLLIGLLILIHELGHFLAARRAGIVVQEFAIGFGRTLWSRRRGDTTFSLKLIPLGGYVKMLGDQDASSFSRFTAGKYDPADKTFAIAELKKKGINPETDAFHKVEQFMEEQRSAMKKDDYAKLQTWYAKDYIPNHPGNYDNQPILDRALVIVAGVFMNFVLAIAIFYFMFLFTNFSVDLVRLGNPVFAGAETSDVPFLFDVYDEDSSELAGSLIVDAEGRRFVTRDEFETLLQENYNEPMQLQIFTPDGYRDVTLALNGDGVLTNFDEDVAGKVRIVSTTEGMPAAEAGLEPNYVILSFAGEDVTTVSRMLELLRENQGGTADIRYVNAEGDTEETMLVLPEVEEGQPILGAGLGENTGYLDGIVRVNYNDNRLLSGVLHTFNMTAYTVTGLGTLISSSIAEGCIEPVSQGVSSVVGVAGIINELVRLRDFISIINLAGLISVALAFANILPVPLFDGGNLLFLIIEAIRKRPISEKKQEIIGTVTFVLVIIFMLLIVFKDLFPDFTSSLIRGICGG
ncbi:MAG: Regulator of sigma-E protease RseP [candidate division WS6 bacterium OLB20]|uniref:Regulator of sigma-E protease RseP n=1 Tax=candidate division WS6 bacterium OLB20 TaxID=1617426 RepID=A0A136LYA8_9BACT|nr:MAG: Regulator of sigma-E protease RseP [candidate division WS6 bacterium OLB20]